MPEWSDLRHFLAVARSGSTLAAAKVLCVSQSTVHRRISALESSIGRPLVQRHPTGYRLTKLGEEMRPLAERVEAAVADFALPAGNARNRPLRINPGCYAPLRSAATGAVRSGCLRPPACHRAAGSPPAPASSSDNDRRRARHHQPVARPCRQLSQPGAAADVHPAGEASSSKV